MLFIFWNSKDIKTSNQNLPIYLKILGHVIDISKRLLNMRYLELGFYNDQCSDNLTLVTTVVCWNILK